MNERHRQAKRVQKDCADLYLLLLMHRRGRPPSRTPLTAPARAMAQRCSAAPAARAPRRTCRPRFRTAHRQRSAVGRPAPLGVQRPARRAPSCSPAPAQPGARGHPSGGLQPARRCVPQLWSWAPSGHTISPASPNHTCKRAQPAARGGGARVRGPPGRPAAVCSALPPAQRGAPGRPRRRRRAARRVRRRPGRARRRIRGRGRARAAPGERCAARAAAPRGACPAMREV